MSGWSGRTATTERGAFDCPSPSPLPAMRGKVIFFLHPPSLRSRGEGRGEGPASNLPDYGALCRVGEKRADRGPGACETIGRGFRTHVQPLCMDKGHVGEAEEAENRAQI